MSKNLKFILSVLIMSILTVVVFAFVSESTSCVEYNITYVLDCDAEISENPESYSATSLPLQLKQPVRSGYEFLGWYDADGNKVDSLKVGTNGNITLTAKWAEKFSITYNLNGGKNNTLNPKEFTKLSDTIVLQNAEKEGYTFLGWYSDEYKVLTINKGTVGNIELTAKYQINDYSITYFVDNGSNSEQNPHSYNINSKYTLLPAVSSRVGYHFLGWYNEFNECISEIKQGTIGNLRLAARFTPNVYAISYDVSGGFVGENPASYTVESGDIILNDPSREGFDFVGWFMDGVKVNKIPKGTMGNIKLTAKWSNYKIVYNLNGGSNNALNGDTYCKNELPLKLSDPSKFGMDFAGWYYNNTLVTAIPKNTSGDIVLTAEWGSAGLNIVGDKLISVGTFKGNNLVVPKGVTTINNAAFLDCTTIKNIALPDTLLEIGENAFSGCVNITNIVVPSNVKTIKEKSFYGCSKLQSVVFDYGSALTVVARSTFENCVSLNSINISDKIKSIKELAFNGCVNLKSIKLPNGLTYLGGFSNTGLTEIVIPSTVNIISSGAFENTKLSSVIIPQSVETMGLNVFKGCNSKIKIFCEATSVSADWDGAWNSISFNGDTKFDFYLYSETSPSHNGNYWHYVDGFPSIWTV